MKTKSDLLNFKSRRPLEEGAHDIQLLSWDIKDEVDNTATISPDAVLINDLYTKHPAIITAIAQGTLEHKLIEKDINAKLIDARLAAEDLVYFTDTETTLTKRFVDAYNLVIKGLAKPKKIDAYLSLKVIVQADKRPITINVFPSFIEAAINGIRNQCFSEVVEDLDLEYILDTLVEENRIFSMYYTKKLDEIKGTTYHNYYFAPVKKATAPATTKAGNLLGI